MDSGDRTPCHCAATCLVRVIAACCDGMPLCMRYCAMQRAARRCSEANDTQRHASRPRLITTQPQRADDQQLSLVGISGLMRGCRINHARACITARRSIASCLQALPNRSSIQVADARLQQQRDRPESYGWRMGQCCARDDRLSRPGEGEHCRACASGALARIGWCYRARRQMLRTVMGMKRNVVRSTTRQGRSTMLYACSARRCGLGWPDRRRRSRRLEGAHGSTPQRACRNQGRPAHHSRLVCVAMNTLPRPRDAGVTRHLMASD